MYSALYLKVFKKPVFGTHIDRSRSRTNGVTGLVFERVLMSSGDLDCVWLVFMRLFFRVLTGLFWTSVGLVSGEGSDSALAVYYYYHKSALPVNNELEPEQVCIWLRGWVKICVLAFLCRRGYTRELL